MYAHGTQIVSMSFNDYVVNKEPVQSDIMAGLFGSETQSTPYQ